MQLGIRQLVLLDVGVLHIANRVGQAPHKGSHSLVTLTPGTGRPVHGLAFTDFFFPLGVHFREVVGKPKGRARAIGTAHRADLGTGQGHTRIERNDGRVVPLGDFAQVDIAQHLARELELAGLNTLDIHHRHDATDHGGKLHQPLGLQIGIFKGLVRGTKIHRLGLNLLNTRTGANRLVVDFHARGLVVIGRPF